MNAKYIYIYVYIYMCVCVCVCVCAYMYIYVCKIKNVDLRQPNLFFILIWNDDLVFLSIS